MICVFFFQAEDGIRDRNVTGVQTCALPISVGTPVGIDAATCGPRAQRMNESARRMSRAPRIPETGSSRACLPRTRTQIGRASCRERGEIEVGGEGLRGEKRSGPWGEWVASA